MVVLESCPKHNMVAYLEKTKGNAQFHEIRDFSIHKLDFYCSLESSIRRDLLFNDDNEIECLTVANIYENLPLMGNLEAKKKFLMYPSPLSGGHTSDRAEGSLNLDELFVLCTNLSNRVLALETSKDAQAIEILKLKTRIQRKKKRRERKKDRKLGEKCKPRHLTPLEPCAFVNLDADGMDYMDIEEAVNEGRQISIVVPEVSTVNISTASRPEVSTATPMTPPTTISVFDNEYITLVETLVKMKDDKAKIKGVAIKEVKEIEEVMTDKGKKSSMETFVPNDKADYYFGITSITVNWKNAYELKGKFLDDLHNNAFNGTNGKDVVEHIEHYLKIFNPIKLPKFIR
ncbi:hypothetical protein Tco_0588597 [Tanacetum coccineum]